MPAMWGGIAAGVGSLAGGLLGGSSASKAAAASAQAQLEAARIAAEAQKFRPVGVTTNYGTSNFQFDKNGYLTGAGYDLAQPLQDIQDRLLSGYASQLDQAQGVDTRALQQGSNSLFNLGQQYLSTSPQQAAQQYMYEQQALLAPTNEQNLAGLRNKLFQTGRTGLATGGTSAGGRAATNPEMAAYYNSLAQQQAQLAANATAAGQQRATFGQNLLTGGAGLQETAYGLQSKAYSPLMTSLGLGQSIEQLGQSPLDIGAQLGGRSATAGANVGQSLLTGGLSAARTQQAANQYSPVGSAITGIANSPYLSSWFNSTLNQPTTNYGMTGNLAASDSAYNPAVNYSGTYDPTAGSTSWYD